jgi:hypothetical protein
MNIKKYFLVTEACVENPNPGDILIGQGIEYLIREAEMRLGNYPIFNYVSMFHVDELAWNRIYDEADYLIISGTPIFNLKEMAPHIKNLLPYVKQAKKNCIITAFLACGSGYSKHDATIEESVNIIHEANQENFQEIRKCNFDLITVRDLITKKLFEKSNMYVEQFLCSVFYANNLSKIKASENKLFNLIIVRNQSSLKPKIQKKLFEFEKQFTNNKPIIYLSHSIDD